MIFKSLPMFILGVSALVGAAGMDDSSRHGMADRSSARSGDITLSDAQRSWLAEHRVIRVAPDPYFPPIEWFDQSGAGKGIAIDYLKIVEKKLGVTFEIVKCATWDEVLSKARNREVDMLSAAAKTPNRSEYLAFTRPHLNFPGVIITRKGVSTQLGIKDLKGMKVAIVSGYVWHELIGRDHPEVIIDPVPDMQTGLKKVSFGIDDAMVENIATATWGIEREGITNLQVSGETGYYSKLSFAARRDWPMLETILDTALAQVPQSKRDAVYKNWIRLAPTSVVRQPLFWGALAGVISAAGLLILFVLQWNRALQRQVGQRTADMTAVICSIPDGIYVLDREYKITLFNDSLAAMMAGMGLAAPVKGAHILDVMPQTSDYLIDEIEDIFNTGRSTERKHDIVVGDHVIKARMRRVPLFDSGKKVHAVLNVVQDLTSEYRIQAALRESEQKFSEMVENANSIILRMDRAGKITFFNKFAENFFGFSKSEIIGQSIIGTIVPATESSGRDLAGLMEEIARDPTPFSANENENILHDGSRVWVSWSNKPIGGDPKNFTELLCVGNDITALKQMQGQLSAQQAELEKRYRFLFEESPAGALIMRPDGTITDISRSLAASFGYPREEIIGRKSMEFVTEDERENQIARLRRRMKGEQNEQVEVKVYNREGAIHTILFSPGQAVIYENGEPATVLVAGIDITDRKAVERSLAESERRYRFLFDESPVVSLVIDRKGLIHDANKATFERLGYKREAILGKPALEYIAPASRGRMADMIALRFAGERAPEENDTPVLASDGSVRLINFAGSSAILKSGGTIEGILITGIDMTERRRLEEREKLQRKNLIQADKMASLGILVSGVAHEINNPNNFIILNADNLADVWRDARRELDGIAAEGREFSLAGIPYASMGNDVAGLISGIGDGAKRIRTIVQNLKDFARQESGAMDEVVDLHRVVDAATVILANLIKKSTDRFETRFAPSLPAVKGNFQKIEQVVINLLTNACQALPDRARSVCVETTTAGGEVTLIIRDQGCGIRPEDLVHIYDPFFTTKRDSGGTGLGLSISYSIIKDHGGALVITSEPGTGTSARITLPAEPGRSIEQ